MPSINNNVSIIKKWLDQGGDLSKLLYDYQNDMSFEDLKEKVNLILENTDTEAIDSLKEVIDLINNDEEGLSAILKKLDNKVDKDGNKVLSDNNFSNFYKEKINNIPSDFIDENGNVLFGNADSHLLSENSQNNILEGQDNSVGIVKIPAIVGGEIMEETGIISQSDYEGYLDLRYIRFEDFVYFGLGMLEDSTITQYPIKKINGYTKENESLINYNNVESIELDLNNKEEFLVNTIIEKNGFSFSNQKVLLNYDYLMDIGEVKNVNNTHIEGQNNTTISDLSHSSGVLNISGCRGYEIIDIDNSFLPDYCIYTLNEFKGDLCIGDMCSIFYSSTYNYINIGQIDSIDEDLIAIKLNKTIDPYVLTGGEFLYVIAKPFVGNIDVGNFGNTTGYRTSTYLYGSRADGKETIAIGPYSHASGRHSISKGYGSSADGCGVIATRNYQRVAGRYNIEDTEEKYIDIVGNGKRDDSRSNAYTLDVDGNASFLGTISGKDVLINSNLDSISIFGDTKMLDGDSASTYAFNNILLDNKEIYSSIEPIELNSVADVSRDELIINNKLKINRIVKKVVLGDNLKNNSSNSYQFIQQTGTDSNGNEYLEKSFFIDLANAVDINGNPFLSEVEKEKLENGNLVQTYTILCTHFPYYDSFPDSKAYFDLGSQTSTQFRITFYDENAVDIRKNTSTLACYTKEEIQTKIDSGELSGYDIRTLPMVLYFTLIEPVEEELEGDYSIEWNNFIARYKSSSEIMVNGQLIAQNSELIENCILNSQINYLPIIKYIDTELAKKQSKEEGKGLSSNDFTTALLNKLNGIPSNATEYPKVIHFEFDDEYDERIETWDDKSIFNQYIMDGFYYITMNYPYTGSGEYSESVLLLCRGMEDGGWLVSRLLITLNGDIYINNEYPEEMGYEDSNVWRKVSVSQTDLDKKVDKVKGKRLISDEINMVANNVFSDIDDNFDGIIKLDEDFDPATYMGTLLFGEENGGIFKILDKDNNFIGILERTYSDDFPDEAEGYYIATEYFEDLDGVVWDAIEEDGGVPIWYVNNYYKINLKDKIFVSKEQLDEAIGDIETSLENIIQKYGLGGDSV